MISDPGIDPFPVSIPNAWDEAGEVTGFDPRIHYNVTAEFLAEHASLATFRIEPATLQRVFAGDDPTAAQWTVALRFDDEAALMASDLAPYLT